MQPDAIFLIALFAVTTGIIVWLIIRFIYNLGKYDFLGNVLFYIGFAYALCFIFACYANFAPPSVAGETISIVIDGKTATGEIISPKSDLNPLVGLVSSLFDALKMMAAAFDRSIVNGFVKDERVVRVIFGYYYAAVSFFALITTSISTILFVFKSFKAKIGNFFKCWDRKKNIYYIFSDPQVRPSMKLAHELKSEKEGKKYKNIVYMYIESSTLKTQAGTEYRDALKMAGFDVKSEPFSQKLCAKIFNKHFNPQFRGCKHKKIRNVTVYGLFSDDELSTKLAINFTNAINDGILEKRRCGKKYKGNNHYFKVLYQNITKKYREEGFVKAHTKMVQEDLEKLNHFKVFVTYQDADIDISHDFSGKTLHIVNTLSQYDMISSEFVLNNPITNFISINEVENAKEDSLNVTFVGLGKINRPIFEKMTYAYQLWGDGKYLVNYHIVDRCSKEYLEYYSNEFVKKPKDGQKEEEIINKTQTDNEYLEKPYLYKIDADCDGKNLNSFEIISNHLKNVKDNEGRFSDSGFEIFVISLSNTNSDIKAALDLRRALYKNVGSEKLTKTAIFVRVANQQVIDNLKTDDTTYVIDQNELSKQTLGGLVDSKGNRIYVPIIVFGQNTTMSKFIREHYSILDKLGLNTQKAYNADKEDTETVIDLKTRVEWLTKKKIDVLSNIATVYSLKTKLQIFGSEYAGNFENNDEFVSKTKDCLDQINSQRSDCETDFETITSSDKPLMKLAELEHNRWMASEYLFRKYGQRKKANYFSKTNYNEAKVKLETKNPSLTKHICMTTNRGLKDLYKEQIGLTFIKGPNKDKNKENCIKLTFGNDIQAVIDVLKHFRKKEEEAKKKPKRSKKNEK